MFTTIVIQPLYNAFIYIVNYLPGHELWVAVVILTLLLKLILVPLFKKQVRDQLVMQHLSPKLKQLQEKYKDKRELLAKESMELYGKYKVNPLLSIVILLIQLPFLVGLYRIFYYDLSTHKDLLYSGLNFPESISHMFFVFDLTQKSIILATVAAVTQYLVGAVMFKNKTTEENELVKAMNMQMKYFLPFMIGFVSYITPSVIALYMIVTNIFGIVQEIIIKKPLEEKVKKELGEL